MQTKAKRICKRIGFDRHLFCWIGRKKYNIIGIQCLSIVNNFVHSVTIILDIPISVMCLCVANGNLESCIPCWCCLYGYCVVIKHKTVRWIEDFNVLKHNSIWRIQINSGCIEKLIVQLRKLFPSHKIVLFTPQNAFYRKFHYDHEINLQIL